MGHVAACFPTPEGVVERLTAQVPVPAQLQINLTREECNPKTRSYNF
jgi:hypothetical protein